MGGSSLRFGYGAIEAAGIWGGIPPTVYGEAIDPATKVIVASILDAVGYGDYEKGVYDTPQPVLYPVFSGPSVVVDKSDAEIHPTDDRPVFLPDWPEEWKKGPDDPPGWDPDQWEYPPTDEVEEVAIDWGSVVSGAVDIAQGQLIGGGLPNVSGYAAPSTVGGGSFSYPGGAPGKVTVDTATGKITPCRRRRRRRLLTPTDLNDLAALKTIVGGGQAINFAVMKAVRR